MKQILERKKYITAVAKDTHVGIKLQSAQSVLMQESVVDDINEYEQYLKEKDSSTKYRLSFTVSPICSNVLFNAVTEIVYHEGSDDCVYVGKDGVDLRALGGVAEYMKRKNRDASKVSRMDMIRDTAFSHPAIGPFVYHCGCDIFNNHYLRRREFEIVGSMSAANGAKENQYFNEIGDYRRDRNGNFVKEHPMYIPKEYKNSYDSLAAKTVNAHTYQTDTVMSYSQAVKEKLWSDENGWFGFKNPMLLPIMNYNSETINKCMNSNRPCEQYDMYPDRSLFLFTPKYNVYKKRLEYNWDACLTYPFASDSKHPCIYGGNEESNGLKCRCLSNLSAIGNNTDGEALIYFHTTLRNNLSEGDAITFVFTDGENVMTSTEDILVYSIGDENGSDTERSFSVRLADVLVYRGQLAGNIRLRRKVNGYDCRYYVRMFRQVPSFRGTSVLQSDGFSEDELKKYGHPLNLSINRLPFANTVYGDDVAQILINEPVDVAGLKDNLGRNVSELYLTVVKRNRGYKEWYDDGVRHDTKGARVEYSHCFGEVTDGLDMAPVDKSEDYNVHTLHNIDIDSQYVRGTMLDGVIPTNRIRTMSDGVVAVDDDKPMEDVFMGDVVEFSPMTVNETVIEYVYHRFNTAQREYTKDNEFHDITFDNIISDDYDMNGNGFVLSGQTYNTVWNESLDRYVDYPVNLFPEGYYYNPHYLIRLKDFSSEVKQGEHRRFYLDDVKYDEATGTLSGTTTSNAYLETGGDVYAYLPYGTGGRHMMEVLSASGRTIQSVVLRFADGFKLTAIDGLKFYKPNTERPSYAYDLDDGSGRYLWREPLTTGQIMKGSDLYGRTFANGATYIHRNIMFYLKRQDPDGEYGMKYGANAPSHAFSLTVGGKTGDYSSEYYIKENEIGRC